MQGYPLLWLFHLNFWLWWWAYFQQFNLTRILGQWLFDVSGLLIYLFILLIIGRIFFWILNQFLYFWNVRKDLVVGLDEGGLFMFWGWCWMPKCGLRFDIFFIVFYFQILWGFLRIKLLDSGFSDNLLRNYFVRLFVVETYFSRMKTQPFVWLSLFWFGFSGWFLIGLCRWTRDMIGGANGLLKCFRKSDFFCCTFLWIWIQTKIEFLFLGGFLEGGCFAYGFSSENR